MNSYVRIVVTQVFPRDVVCLRNISVDTLHKGDTEDNNNNNNNNNNNSLKKIVIDLRLKSIYFTGWLQVVIFLQS